MAEFLVIRKELNTRQVRKNRERIIWAMDWAGSWKDLRMPTGKRRRRVMLAAETGMDAAAILLVVPVVDAMNAFDGRVPAVDGQNAFWRCLLWCATREPQCDLASLLAGSFLMDYPMS